mmetsp:Transcript_37939/g.95975  ORF Transcript_37939/g.95975 Transcript_37939/m.95975 type:complete len:134 (-) Transcript_37939:623-1024(-)
MSQPTGRINIQTLLLLRKALCHRPLKLPMYQHSPSSLKYHPPSDQTLHNLQQSKARMPQANQPANATMTAMREEMPLVPSQVDVESTGQMHTRSAMLRAQQLAVGQQHPRLSLVKHGETATRRQRVDVRLLLV